MIPIFALALALVTQQAPSAPKATSPTTRATTTTTRPATTRPATISPSDPAKPSGMSQRRWEELQRTAAKKRAFKSARTRSAKAREAAWAAEQKAAQQKWEADYKVALPYLLENQRQQLQRLSAFERNQALQKMAQASDKIAQAIQYQSYYRGR